MLRMLDHDLVEHSAQARRLGAGPAAQHFALDLLEGEHRLAEREGQPWPHLEDGEVVFDELPQRRGALVVGRVSLVHQPRATLDEGGETARRRAVVGDHGGVAELHAGLHHDGDDTLPRVAEAGAAERLAGQRDGAFHIGDRRYCGPGLAGLLTAGSRHLGADDVQRRRRGGGKLCAGRLGRRAELCRPLRRDLCGQRRRSARRGRRRSACWRRDAAWRSRRARSCAPARGPWPWPSRQARCRHG